ncbi:MULTISPECIES: hypothetical protein [Larkinella]|jgi:hypothetical protein|uniref:Uncharacterized protein n=1 Tax=Larkinella punicea TaxID=2315727 RepID=A0A368JHD1_9BACT|nr:MULTISPECIES: hypothetical protein [Larkinella]RCR67067.1 hypothetical protein DUE52_23715 [Larkinella punicea]
MFSQYTWGDFFKVTGIAAVIYYAFVAWKFYREDIRDWVIGRGSKNPIQQPSEKGPIDDEEEEADLFMVRNYPATPSIGNTSAGLAGQVEKPTVENVQDVKAEKPKSVRKRPAKAKSTIEKPQQAIDLPVVPVASEIDPNSLFMPITGIVVPQGEKPLDEVVTSAKEIEVQSDGTVSAKPDSGEESNLLAEVINGQKRKSLGDILSKS